EDTVQLGSTLAFAPTRVLVHGVLAPSARSVLRRPNAVRPHPRVEYAVRPFGLPRERGGVVRWGARRAAGRSSINHEEEVLTQLTPPPLSPLSDVRPVEGDGHAYPTGQDPLRDPPRQAEETEAAGFGAIPRGALGPRWFACRGRSTGPSRLGPEDGATSISAYDRDDVGWGTFRDDQVAPERRHILEFCTGPRYALGFPSAGPRFLGVDVRTTGVGRLGGS
ncbi:hypothetical protein THAOC_37052, partial [Thalassiosira oceanica]